MESIKIDVTGNIARVTEKPIRITSGTAGLPVIFTFDNQWNGLSKTAVFRAGCVQKIRESLEDETTVPWEVLKKPGVWLSIGVYGVDESGTVVIPTIWANVCSIQVGVSPDGDPGIDPTLPVWQRLLGEVGNLSLLRTTKKEDLVSAINEAYGEGEASHIEGINNQAIGIASHTEGKDNVAGAKGFHVLNITLVTNYDNDFLYNILIDDANLEDKASEVYSTGDYVQWDAKQHHYGKVYIYQLTTSAEGSVLTIVADGSLNMELDADPAENYIYVVGKNFGEVLPANVGIHVEGLDNIATGKAAHTEGYKNKSIGNYSHTEGRGNTAHYTAHAEGITTQALADYSHTEGHTTKTTGYGAHAEGLWGTASGKGSHTEGIGTLATDEAQHAGGKFNALVIGPWVIGKGSEGSRSNAAQMDWDGNVRFDGDVVAFGCNGKPGISLRDLKNTIDQCKPLDRLCAINEAELQEALSSLLSQMKDGSVKSFEISKRLVYEDFSDFADKYTVITNEPTTSSASIKWNGATPPSNWSATLMSGSVILQPEVSADGDVSIKMTPENTGRMQIRYSVPPEVYRMMSDSETYRVSVDYHTYGIPNAEGVEPVDFKAQLETKSRASNWDTVNFDTSADGLHRCEHEFTIDKSYGMLTLTFGIAWPGGSTGSMTIDNIALERIGSAELFDGESAIGQLYRADNSNALARFDVFGSAGSCMCAKTLYGGTWQPLEWENPPYQNNKIYRTTERFKGYPVYAVNIACGMAVHGDTQVTLSAGIVGDPEFEACHNEWTVVGYEGSMYDAFYNGYPDGNWTDKVGEYPLWSAFSSIKAMWSANGLTLNFSYKDSSFANTMEGDTYITVKFIKKETY